MVVAQKRLSLMAACQAHHPLSMNEQFDTLQLFHHVQTGIKSQETSAPGSRLLLGYPHIVYLPAWHKGNATLWRWGFGLRPTSSSNASSRCTVEQRSSSLGWKGWKGSKTSFQFGHDVVSVCAAKHLFMRIREWEFVLSALFLLSIRRYENVKNHYIQDDNVQRLWQLGH